MVRTFLACFRKICRSPAMHRVLEEVNSEKTLASNPAVETAGTLKVCAAKSLDAEAHEVSLARKYDLSQQRAPECWIELCFVVIPRTAEKPTCLI